MTSVLNYAGDSPITPHMLAKVLTRILSRRMWPILILCAARVAAGADLPSDAQIRSYLRNCIERDHWGVGIVAGIIDEHGSRIISCGKLDHGSSAGVDGDTLFEIGSITKTFTALLLQDMVARGEMKLDDPVEKFLPEKVKVPSKDGRKITLLDLATHRSGLPRDMNDWTVPAMYDFLGRCHLLSKPGTKILYSNLGFCLLGHAIELKAGTNFESLVQQRICQPLHMDSTCIKPTPELRPRWAPSHGDENRSVWDIDAFYSGLGGAGAVRSSVNDLLKYVAAQLALTTNALIPLMKQTQLVRFPHAFGEEDLAMPWWIYHEDGASLITHGGATGGQKAFIGFDLASKRGIVVLANRSDFNQQTVEPFGRYLLHPTVEPVPVSIPVETLDSYAGLYLCPAYPQVTSLVRRDGDVLIAQLLGSAGDRWIPQSKTGFAGELGGTRMDFSRSLSGNLKVAFTYHGRVTSRFYRVSRHSPDSLIQPMLKPLDAKECQLSEKSVLQGTWEGTLRRWYWPFISRQGNLKIAERSPGFFCAELNIPLEHVEKEPIAVIYNPPEIELAVKSGGAFFKGKVNSTNSKIVGHIIQGKTSTGLTLTRANRTVPALGQKN
jgi:serine-type D-Ala-D-Ala carboxypeptidase/endopeptidase